MGRRRRKPGLLGAAILARKGEMVLACLGIVFKLSNPRALVGGEKWIAAVHVKPKAVGTHSRSGESTRRGCGGQSGLVGKGKRMLAATHPWGQVEEARNELRGQMGAEAGSQAKHMDCPRDTTHGHTTFRFLPWRELLVLSFL